ncbi:MAG: alpha/beta hydrolase [Syntrophales bacterium]
MNIRVFIHGLESTGWGVKGMFFRERYPDMIIEDYTGSLENRMDQLGALLKDKKEMIIVGSSYGGLMAALYASKNTGQVCKLILLAPALHIEAFAPCRNHHLDVSTYLFHGKNDDIVPPGEVRLIAEKTFTHLTYYLVDDDHSLHRTFPEMPWDTLLVVP